MFAGITASEGAVLQRERESGGSKDPYAVAVQKDSLTVGHILHNISCLCSVFARRGGSIGCTITGASCTRTGKSLVKTSRVLK